MPFSGFITFRPFNFSKWCDCSSKVRIMMNRNGFLPFITAGSCISYNQEQLNKNHHGYITLTSELSYHRLKTVDLCTKYIVSYKQQEKVCIQMLSSNTSSFIKLFNAQSLFNSLASMSLVKQQHCTRFCFISFVLHILHDN